MKSSQNIITLNDTIQEALVRLNDLSGTNMTLIVVDDAENKRVAGTLTDGDIRRALIGGVTLGEKVEKAMRKDFKRLSASVRDNVEELRAMRRAGITMIPVTDGDGRLVEILNLNENYTKLPLRAILMAGGKGERLRPLTLDTPKPLLKVDGKPIIDYNIEAIQQAGINEITVCARYLAEKIKQHFAEPAEGVVIKCVTETEPMGTIGAAALIPIPEEGDTLVMNSDLLTTISLEELYLKHSKTRADVTVGVIPYQVSVPYAILSTEDEKVTGIEEKPSYSHYANAGIYIFKNSILKGLPKDRPTDAPDLIRKVISEGKKVTYHVINGTWIDVGSPAEFKQAQELMRHHRNLNKSRFDD